MKMLLALLLIVSSLAHAGLDREERRERRKERREQRRMERLARAENLQPDSRRDDNLFNGMSPKLYAKRANPILNIAFVYYGDYYTDEDMSRVEALLKERFAAATDQMIQLNVAVKALIPFKSQLADFPDYRQEYVTEPERLQRLWYYDNVGAKILKEVYDVVKADSKLSPNLKAIDALVIVTGAQFDALGFASGRVAVTENPMEIAWGLKDGGRVDYVSDEKVVDELIHEIGHVMFLDHAASQCFKPGMDHKASQECCATSPAKDDVMSYCRKRDQVKGEFFYKFAECNLRTIKNKIVPAMLEGKQWNITEREKCI